MPPPSLPPCWRGELPARAVARHLLAVVKLAACGMAGARAPVTHMGLGSGRRVGPLDMGCGPLPPPVCCSWRACERASVSVSCSASVNACMSRNPKECLRSVRRIGRGACPSIANDSFQRIFVAPVVGFAASGPFVSVTLARHRATVDAARASDGICGHTRRRTHG